LGQAGACACASDGSDGAGSDASTSDGTSASTSAASTGPGRFCRSRNSGRFFGFEFSANSSPSRGIHFFS
jgi:hypothetical protein